MLHQDKYGCSPVNLSISKSYLYVSGVFGRYENLPYEDSAYGGFVAQYTQEGLLRWSHRFYSKSGSKRVIPLMSATDPEGNVYTVIINSQNSA